MQDSISEDFICIPKDFISNENDHLLVVLPLLIINLKSKNTHKTL